METFVLKDSITNRLTDEEFLQFCVQNRDLRIERNSNREVIIMSPTNSFSGKINTEVLRQLSNWNYETKKGEVFDSSSGFTLPDQAVFSPDAAWVSNEKWNTLTDEQKNSFAPICPEFVIEIRSKSDYLEEVKNKMEKWLRNGALLGWLIDPVAREVHVYSKDTTKTIGGFGQKIAGHGPVSGFFLDLSFLLKI